VAAQLISEHFPLGVVGDKRFDPATETVSLMEFSHLLLYSDGLLEARNADGEMFGKARLEKALGGRARKSGLMQGIKSRLVAFLDGLEPHDDVSVLSVELFPVA
jgi:serine phosphatase RsbU (regulator of sigma subunit)